MPKKATNSTRDSCQQENHTTNQTAYDLRVASLSDLPALCQLEERVFQVDRLSRRSFRRFLQHSQAIFWVAESPDSELMAYALVVVQKGTRLSRLYSLAVYSSCRGIGIAKALLTKVEDVAREKKRLYMRLEVAENNLGARQLYKSLGYLPFDTVPDYYEDHSTAVRMHKQIRHADIETLTQPMPWFRQTTPFTCGPASLMMAMKSLQPKGRAFKRESGFDRETELNIWREATTIYMTSGHGGCHPVGLGLSAFRRGFRSKVIISHNEPLFIEGVRDSEKKAILELVDRQFKAEAKHLGVEVLIQNLSQEDIETWFRAGCSILILLSTYRLDGRKAPHWVAISAVDEVCFYVHDPDPIGIHDLDANFTPMGGHDLDACFIPIARDDFEVMSVYGRKRTRTAVVIEAKKLKTQSQPRE
jgi:ribosomal protein S18 acetylase RimI-like enzyme